MTELRLYNREVNSVFELLGSKEDDITYSLGWAFANSERFIRAFLNELTDTDPGTIVSVDLQDVIAGGGRTDIEIRTTKLHVILEAKRGWWLPGEDQLSRYARRFEGGDLEPLLVVAAEASPEYARKFGYFRSKTIAGNRVTYIPWSRFAELASAVRSASRVHTERRLMQDVYGYLKGLMSTQDIYSNMVYVVSLGYDDIGGTGETFVSIVEKHNTYFHPFGERGFPKVPPNYLGFRYDGKLQSIRHVDSYEVHDDPWNKIRSLKGRTPWDPSPHLSYELGERIVPDHDVRSTSIRNRRLWAPLDLLLTCETIPEAEAKGNDRAARAR